MAEWMVSVEDRLRELKPEPKTAVEELPWDIERFDRVIANGNKAYLVGLLNRGRRHDD